MTGKGIIFTKIKMFFAYMRQVLFFDFQFDSMFDLTKMLQQVKCITVAQSFVIFVGLAMNNLFFKSVFIYCLILNCLLYC